MKKEIQDFTLRAEEILHKDNNTVAEFLPEMKTAIEFYQHERLVHLIVTMFFALFMFICLLMVFVAHKVFVLPCVLLLVMVVFYVAHYFFLENSVQKLYRMYLEAAENCRK